MSKQGIIASYAGDATPLLLDSVSGATYAFSLRKVRAAYSGSCIRVRRSDTGAEQDIGFDSNGFLDTASILSFVPNGYYGYVVTWYDQSGNGYDITAGDNSDTNRPWICGTNHAITLSNGKAAIRFTPGAEGNSANGRRLYRTNMSTATVGSATDCQNSWAMVAQVDGYDTSIHYGNWGIRVSDSTMCWGILFGYGSSLYYYAGNNVNSTSGGRLQAVALSGFAAAQHVFTGFHTGSNMYMYQDNALISSAARALTPGSTTGQFSVGQAHGSAGWSNYAMMAGYMQELIIWNTSKYSDKDTIYNDQNNFW